MSSQTSLNVSRTQWAVGPGFFHSSTIQLGDQHFTYVYDCGSSAKKKKEVLGREIDDFLDVQLRNKSTKIDICFISHFDEDHIGGIKKLASLVHIKHFVIPFVEPEERIFNAARQLSDQEQNLSQDFTDNEDELVFFADITADPESTLRQLTANEDPNSVLTVTPEGGIETGSVTLSREYNDAESNYFSVQLTQRNAIQLKTSRQQYEHSLQLWEWKLYTLKRFNKAIKNQFINEVKQEYRKGADQESPLRPDEIRDLILSHQKILIHAYDNTVKQAGFRTRNSTSLMLYSGPPTNLDFSPDGRTYFKYFDYTYCYHRGGDPRHSTPTRPCSRHAHHIVSFPAPPQIGWIGLGDIEISKKQTRADEINTAFEESKPLVAAYCLPHHGSLNDWHKSLLNGFQTMPICVVSANGKYGHPSHQVICDVNSAGSTLMVTTTEEASRLHEHIEATLLL